MTLHPPRGTMPSPSGCGTDPGDDRRTAAGGGSRGSRAGAGRGRRVRGEQPPGGRDLGSRAPHPRPPARARKADRAAIGQNPRQPITGGPHGPTPGARDRRRPDPAKAGRNATGADGHGGLAGSVPRTGSLTFWGTPIQRTEGHALTEPSRTARPLTCGPAIRRREQPESEQATSRGRRTRNRRSEARGYDSGRPERADGRAGRCQGHRRRRRARVPGRGDTEGMRPKGHWLARVRRRSEPD